MGLRLLYFSASWCLPCKKFGPLLEAEAGARGIKVEKADVDSDTVMAEAWGVQSVPTVIARDGGDVLGRTGALSPGALRKWLDELGGDGA